MFPGKTSIRGLPLAAAIAQGVKGRPLRDLPKVAAGFATGAARSFGIELGRRETRGRYGIEPPRTVGFNINEPEAEAVGERLATAIGLVPAGYGALSVLDRALFGARTAVRAIPAAAQTPAAQKLVAALKAAKPVRAEQEALYSAERSRRLGKALAVAEKTPGEAGARRMLGALKGELPKVQFEPILRSETAASGITAIPKGAVKPGKIIMSQGEVDELFQAVKSSPLLPGYSKVSGIDGLGKLLVGQVPQESELQLLTRVFGEEFVTVARRGRQTVSALFEVAAIPRALAATLDLSAPFRQGLVAGARYPRQFVRAFGTMFRVAAKEEAFTALKESIVNRPTFRLMDQAGLAITGLDEATLLAREEQFLSRLPERIPIFGRLVRASNRAYTGFLIKLRADVFDELLKRSTISGVPQTEQLHASIAKFVNAATGRGDLGRLGRAGNELGTALFSPRLLASRLNFLDVRGVYGGGFYGSLEPFARKEALKSMLSLAAAGTTVVGLAALAGTQVGTDPRSADFGKLRFGNTRLDVWGGFQQYPRIAAQLITGKLISSTTGKTLTLGEGYRPLTRKDIAFRFFESKANPLVGAILEVMEGRTFEGQKPTLTSTAKRTLTPIILQDLWEISQDDPTLLPILGLGVFGMGVQTYGPKGTGAAMGDARLLRLRVGDLTRP